MTHKLDPLSFHFQDTTSAMGVSRKLTKNTTTTFLVLAAIIVGVVVSVAQMRQRDKVDALAVKEGKIPAITLSVKK